MALQSINPATDEIMATFDEMDPTSLDRIIEDAHTAHRQWITVPVEQRARLMHAAASILRDRKKEYGKLMALEMGKPISQGIAEAEKCAWVCDYYADTTGRFLAEELITTSARESYVRFDPLGVVLAVMPWNFPFWQVFRFAAPALMAGNAGLLKHASNVPQCAQAIEKVFVDAGFPTDLFRSLMIGAGPVEYVLDHHLVRAATLTGSEFAGSMVASRAGRNLKKTVLELGGSDPFIVLDDADIDLAAEQAVTSRMLNTGQSCISAKRFIVHHAIADAFEQKFLARMMAIKTGDPLDHAVDAGPLARNDLRDELHEQVQKSIREGAQLLCGGKAIGTRGCFYEPTVLTGVTPDMTVFREETFGPVAPIIRVSSESEALSLANDSEFGLGASVWTRNIERAKEFAVALDTGNIFINSFVKSDPRMPFGGTKKSGYGRELSHYGLKEFVTIKTVWIE